MRTIALVVACLATCGCGKDPHRLAEVSGKVTLNGKALPNAKVAFMPESKPGALPSPTSHGETDAQGNFTMTSTEAKPGAVVGTHKVYISTRKVKAGDEETGGGVVAQETVPEKYNVKSELSFTVPEEGTKSAEFNLTK